VRRVPRATSPTETLARASLLGAATGADGEATAGSPAEGKGAESGVEQAIDDGMASFSAGFASGLEAFSEVRVHPPCPAVRSHSGSESPLILACGAQVATAVGKNTVVGKMVLSGASKAIGQSAEGVAGVGEGKHRMAERLERSLLCCLRGHIES
jgi:hypothetical protein